MNQLFNQLPENAKVWIYQSSRHFNDDEAVKIKSLISEFVRQWTSHSRQVIADGALIHNLFVVLVADETAFSVSGCSIDSSVSFIKHLEREFNVGFFDRLAVAYLKEGQVAIASQHEFQGLIDAGEATENTIVFNNLVSSLSDFRQKWQLPLSVSWHARFFKTGAISH